MKWSSTTKVNRLLWIYIFWDFKQNALQKMSRNPEVHRRENFQPPHLRQVVTVQGWGLVTFSIPEPQNLTCSAKLHFYCSIQSAGHDSGPAKQEHTPYRATRISANPGHIRGRSCITSNSQSHLPFSIKLDPLLLFFRLPSFKWKLFMPDSCLRIIIIFSIRTVIFFKTCWLTCSPVSYFYYFFTYFHKGIFFI